VSCQAVFNVKTLAYKEGWEWQEGGRIATLLWR